jgi:hypothetical protein
MQPSLRFALIAAATSSLIAQSHRVVPATNATSDALAYEWMAGATALQRQILVGESHLTQVIGKSIQAIELRRTAVAEQYIAGSMTWNLSLSIAPHLPVACSHTFVANVGPSPVNVFNGTVNLPASPPTGAPGTAVPWTPANTVRVAFTTPFAYQGGTLCLDIVGTPIAGQTTWWMADAAEEVITGSSAVEVGAGCGSYGGPTRAWSRVDVRSLVPGGHAVFRARGTPNGPALAIFGAAMPNAFPMAILGMPTPNCQCHLDPFNLLAFLPAVFVPETNPLAFASATAKVVVPLPASASIAGYFTTIQWLDLIDESTSNAFTWTVGATLPTLDMALVEGHPSLATGHATNYLAPVLRFEYQ